ncbi:hypothetical protein Droror1_Dr00027830 [Drosera rotundifolia]
MDSKCEMEGWGAAGFGHCWLWFWKWKLLTRMNYKRSYRLSSRNRKQLRPYFDLTNAVRFGNLEFKKITEKCADTFSKDRTHNLVVMADSLYYTKFKLYCKPGMEH